MVNSPLRVLKVLRGLRCLDLIAEDLRKRDEFDPFCNKRRFDPWIAKNFHLIGALETIDRIQPIIEGGMKPQFSRARIKPLYDPDQVIHADSLRIIFTITCLAVKIAVIFNCLTNFP